MKIETLFDIGDKVTVDQCSSIVAVVLAVMVRGKNTTYQVGWVQDGRACEPWIEDWRIERWEG